MAEVRRLPRANTSLKPKTDLLNSKFEQYKYTSGREHEVTYRRLQHTPHRTISDNDFSYQMTRASCLFNCLFFNPSSKFSRFTYISRTSPERYSIIDGSTGKVLCVIKSRGDNFLYNVNVVWANKEMLVGLGSELVTLVHTGEEELREVRRQHLERQCLLLYSFSQGACKYVITCWKQEEAFVHEVMREKDGMFEVVSTIKLPGIARFLSAKDGLLTLICEGKLLTIESDPVEEEETVQPTKEDTTKVESDERKTYTWNQTADDVEVSIELPSGIIKSDLSVEIGLESLEVRTKGGQELFKSKLFSKVEPKESVWQMSSDKRRVEVHLMKFQAAHNWAHLINTPNYDPQGNLISQISDLNEEDLRAMMRRMESLNEYTSETLDKSPLYTPSRDLEECDELDGQQILISGYDISDSESVKHKYLVEMAPGSLLLSHFDRGFAVAHSVDACYYDVNSLNSPWKHSTTFHAFNMIQATKTHKKYIVTGPEKEYVAIVDTSRYVYIYSCSEGSDYGKLLVMTLDQDDSEILGVCPFVNKIILLTETNFITINFAL